MRTRRRLKAGNKPKSMGAHRVAPPPYIFVGGPLNSMGISAFRARKCRYSQRIPGRAALSRALARALTKGSALRTACEATCEGYITLKARTLTEILKLCWQVGAGVWGEHNYPQFTTAVKRIIILNCMYRAANITQVWFVLAPAVWLWAEGECTTTHTSSRDKSTMTPCLRADIRA